MFVSKIVFRLVNCHLMNSNLVSQRRWNNSNNLIFSTWKFIVLFSLSDHSLLSKNTIGKEESTFHVSRKYFFFFVAGNSGARGRLISSQNLPTGCRSPFCCLVYHIYMWQGISLSNKYSISIGSCIK